MVAVAVVHRMMNIGWQQMDCKAVNRHRMATGRTYRTDFVLKRIANVSNRPLTDRVYFGRWHDLCMHPKCHDDCRRPDDGMPGTVPLADFVPLQPESSPVLHLNNLVD